VTGTVQTFLETKQGLSNLCYNKYMLIIN